MLNDKTARLEFERWLQELDYRCENRPVVYAFHREDSDILLTPEQRAIVQNNLAAFDRKFVGKRQCANCRYPLAEDEGFYVSEVGQCCWLCHDMDMALRQTRQPAVHYGTIFEWFYAAHNEWKREEKKNDGGTATAG